MCVCQAGRRGKPGDSSRTVDEQDEVLIGSDSIDSYFDALTVLLVLSECSECSLSALCLLPDCSLRALFVLPDCSNCSLAALIAL